MKKNSQTDIPELILEYNTSRIVFAEEEEEEEEAHVVISLKDITERKQAEDSLRLRNAALEAAANAIVITDREGLIQWANPAFTTLTGYAVAEAVGKNPRELVKSGRQHQAFYKGLWDTILAGQVWRGEIINRRKDGSLYTEEMTITPVRDERGDTIHFVAIKQDITEKKSLEAQLLRTQRLESVGRLASGIAHDLNNILAPILMGAPLLRENIMDQDTLRLLDTIEANAQRGANIIKQLLSFGRGLAGERTSVQLRALVQDMVGIIRETFPKNIKARRELPAQPWLVNGDVTQLHQVLMNLCVNARDAMPQGGTLTLGVENVEMDDAFAQMSPGARAGRYVVLRVMDTGSGILPEHLDTIFDPFFTTKEIDKGTGLGLSTVLGIVKSHGGFIQVNSQVGQGTQFKIYLPACEAPEAGQAMADPGPAPQGHGELVLVADDEEAVRRFTKKTLERHGYRVVTAADGVEGLARYAQNREQVQAVVTDLMMPFMDGPAFIRALRQMNSEAKIIAVSGLQTDLALPGDPEVQVQATLAKPFTAAALLQTLQDVLHPAPEGVPAAANRA